jgi:hypothetical protein
MIGTLRERLQPTADTVKGKLAPMLEATAPATAAAAKSTSDATKPGRKKARKAAWKAAKATKPHRKELASRAREVSKAAAGDKLRRWPLVLAVFAVGAGVGVAVGALAKRSSTEPYNASAGSPESLNGAHRAQTQASTPATEDRDIGQ